MMLAAQYGTVSDIEVVWTLIATGGAVISVGNLLSAFGDMRNSANVSNGRRWIARSSLRLESSRLSVQLIFIAIGLGAMLLPDLPTTVLPFRYVLFGAIFRWGLIIASSLITYQSWTNRELRKRLLDDLEFHRSQYTDAPRSTPL